MLDFSKAAENKKQSKLFQDIYKILARSEKRSDYTKDSQHKHSTADIEEVQQLTYDHICAQRVASGENYQTVDEVRSKLTLTKDGFYNPMSKIGTGADPSMAGTATIPLAISPFEATAIYSSGGLAEIIINKKAKGILLNGYTFKSDNKNLWSKEKINTLHESAEKTNFQDALANANRDGLLYGGAVLYPVFKKDTPASFAYSPDALIKHKIVGKDSIAYWVSTDRWNTVLVPNYNISAQDYMSAKSYYIPLAGYEVATARSAIIRPKQLPYWGAIRQLGWGVSDLEGYMRSIIGYEMSIASIPLMAQQMSLLLYEMPLDTLLAQIGVDEVKKLMALNSEQMKDWSMANPKILNALGKVYTVNRQYSGYPDLMLTMRQDIAAQSGIPESVLFHTQPKGFSNNTEEVLLKQSETIKMSQQSILPSLENIKDILIANAFGTDSEEFAHRDELHFTFDTPVVSTDSERAETAARFTSAINSAKQAGIPITAAVNIVSQFFKDSSISDEDLELIKASQERDELTAKLVLEEKQQTLKQLKEGNDESNKADDK